MAVVPVITIDGPSGAGKGTVTRLVAEKLGFHLLDSGALYRLTALAAIKSGVDLADENALGVLAAALPVAFEIVESDVVVTLSGEDVSAQIRTEEVGMTASRVAAYPAVRSGLLACQKNFRQLPGLIADGRDMGTRVFPDAPLKIFLTASSQERARRRVLQLQEKGVEADFSKVLTDIEARDKADRERKESPLVPAVDAIEIDCTALSIEQVLDRVTTLAAPLIAT